MTTEAMLAEILAKLEEMPAPWRILSGPPTPPSPSLNTTHIVATDADQEREVRASASFPNSKPSPASAAASTSSPTLVPPLELTFAIPIAISDDRERALSILTASSDDCEHEAANSTTSMDVIHAVPIAGSNNQAREIDIPTSCKLATPSSVPSASSTTYSTPPTPFPTSAPFKADDRANPTTSNLVTAASASPTPSPTSAPSLDAALDFKIGVTKLFIASPTRCSTLSLYRSSSNFASDQDSRLQTPVGTTKHLLLLYAKCSMLDTPTQAIINNHTAMVERHCCTFGVHIQSCRLLPWPPWVFARVFRTWVLLMSPLSLLRPPDTSSSSCKPCIDSSCTLTFDPGITLLSTGIVMSTTSGDQAMVAFLPRKEQFRGILALRKSREEFLTTVELDMPVTSKCSTLGSVRYYSAINTTAVSSILMVSEVILVTMSLSLVSKLRPTPWPSYCSYRAAPQFFVSMATTCTKISEPC